ncbi:hypothetical protein [Streptomyces sp. NPDC051016]|uniref:hypothetical protein n=1 Tax=Streptomyces sp. NPDC051016 TaxID=3365638 RepID=UPI0037BBAE28
MLAALCLGGHLLVPAGAGSSPPRAGARDVASDLRVSLPLQAYQLTPREQADADQALQLLVRSCMERAGFTWYVPAEPRPKPDPLARRYGVVERRTAERYGYHPPADKSSGEIARRRERILSEPGADVAYFGSQGAKNADRNAGKNTGRGGAGCASLAQRKLMAGADGYRGDIGAQLSWVSLEMSRKDPHVISARRDWEKCMRSRGYRYESPEKAIADPAWHLDSPVVGSRERATALADVTCKETVATVRIWSRAEGAIQRRLIRENAARLNETRRGLEAFRRTVRAVLGG